MFLFDLNCILPFLFSQDVTCTDMAAEGGVHCARQVSEAFVEKYYHLVGTTTHAAHKFYGNDSLVTRPGPDGTIMSFPSLEVKQ